MTSNDKLTVVLVVPNFRWSDWDKNTLWHFVPYNLCLLAAMVRGICDVSIIDAFALNLSEKDLGETLKQKQPDVVGITVLMDQYGSSGHKVASIAKQYCENVLTVFGGVYATTNSDQVIEDPNVDYVVIGEGEYVFRDLLGFFQKKNARPHNGLAFKIDGRVVNGGHADFITDLDKIPFPAYDLIDFARYASEASVTRRSIDSPRAFPYARMFTSRGCPFGCSFCQVASITGSRFRPRSPQNVLDEIRWLKETFGVKSLIFDDDNLFTDMDRAKAIFRGMIEQDLTMPYSCISVAVFRVDEEMLQLMKASGCCYIDIAIESGDPRVLKEIVRKPVDLGQAHSMVAMARNAGIYVAANFIVGFPTETWDEIRTTIRFAETLNADYAKIFALIPLPHTRIWDMIEATKSMKSGFSRDKVRWNEGQVESDEFSAADLTILRAFEWDRINFTDPTKRQRTADMMGISTAELLTIRRDTLKHAIASIAGQH